jgi:repressor LexA|nr:MAG TPA: Repressor protein CI [Caudoviricetes sp.]
MSEIGKKIAYFRKEKNLTQTDLANILGITKQTIIKYEAGKTSIPVDTLLKISNFFNVPIEIFFYEDFTNSKEIKNNNTIKIPVIPIAYSDMTNIPSVIDWYEFPVSLSKNADYATIQDNNSMEPKIYEDDLILIKKTNELENENIGLFKLNGKIICKRFYKNLITNEILLKSDNLTVDSIKITEKDNFKIVGKVVGIFDYNL